jgi:hypothetical protein
VPEKGIFTKEEFLEMVNRSAVNIELNMKREDEK